MRVSVDACICMMKDRIAIGEQVYMKSNKTFSIRLTVFIIVIVFIIAGISLWWNDAVSPFDPTDSTQITFTVSTGENIRELASHLAADRLIRSPIGFYLLVKFMGIERQIQAGEFRLERTMDSMAIAKELTHGMMDVWVTILEGWRIEEIATKLAKELDIPEKEFLAVAEEGKMFPDTYRFPKDASAAAIAVILEENFQKKITPKMLEDIQKENSTLLDVLTLASIVEREGKTEEDRPVIGGVLLNRMRKGWPLEADATLQYALGYQSKEKTWWKKVLTDEDKLIDSPYNTYKNMGLPPGPIANPGIQAITSVIYPKKTDYMFYLHDAKGNVHYARTLEEHETNIETYLNR